MSDEENEDTTPRTPSVDKWVKDLTASQLAGVKAIVDKEAEDRSAPEFGSMSDSEFSDTVSKKFGYRPRT